MPRGTSTTRKRDIKAWIKNNPDENIGKQKINWRGELKFFDVYRVPIKYLIYNRFNGRIQMETLALITCDREPEPETDEGHNLIQKLLYECKRSQNKKDMDDMASIGQREPGIITQDGVIIDGNRRAMLLNLLGEEYYETAILPTTIGTARTEIEKLEAEIQLSTPAQQDYDPINIYLKVQSMFNNEKAGGIPEPEIPAKICKSLGKSAEDVLLCLRVKELMDKYLIHFGYQNIYTQLKNTEDRFLELDKWWEFLHKDPGDYQRGFINYKKHDVKDLRKLAYDFIRARFRGERFRTIAKGKTGSHFFGNEKIWRAFLEQHKKVIVKDIVKKEPAINRDDPDLLKILKQRDKDYQNLANDLLDENWMNANDALSNKKEVDRPKKLVTDSIQKVDSIDTTHEASKKPETQKQLTELVIKTSRVLSKVSDKPDLNSIITLLGIIKKMKIKKENKPSAIKDLSKIAALAAEIKKELNK